LCICVSAMIAKSSAQLLGPMFSRYFFRTMAMLCCLVCRIAFPYLLCS
jgi:hypothetical protein